MNTFQVIFISSSIFLFSIYCSSTPTKDKSKETASEVPQTEQTAVNDKKSLEILEKNLQNPPPPEDPDLHLKTLEELSEIPDEKARELLIQYASHEDAALREKAVSSLKKRQELTHAGKSDDLLLDIIEKNSETHEKLTATEIQILGETEEARGALILKDNLGKSEEDDALIIQSLGKRLETHEQKNKNTKIISPEEDVLKNYLKEDHDESLKRLALNAVYFSSLRGKDKIFNIASDNSYPISTREEAMALYTDNNSLPKEETAKQYQNLYFNSHGNIDLKEILVIEIARITGKSPETVLSALRRTIEKKRRAEIQRRKKLEAKKRWYNAMKKKPGKEALTMLMIDYGISKGTIKKMDKSLYRHVTDESTRETAAKKFIYSALRDLHPRADFYRLKENGLKSLNNKGIFSALMREALSFNSAKDLQIISLKQLWGINYNEAEKLRFFFKDKRSLLKEFNL